MDKRVIIPAAILALCGSLAAVGVASANTSNITVTRSAAISEPTTTTTAAPAVTTATEAPVAPATEVPAPPATTQTTEAPVAQPGHYPVTEKTPEEKQAVTVAPVQATPEKPLYNGDPCTQCQNANDTVKVRGTDGRCYVMGKWEATQWNANIDSTCDSVSYIAPPAKPQPQLGGRCDGSADSQWYPECMTEPNMGRGDGTPANDDSEVVYYAS